MLASIIANLQNVPQLPATARLPVVKIDRGGGGGPSWPSYDVVDIMTAVQLFPEIAGEDQVTRVVRRMRWIGEALPRIKEAREKREASAFLAGAKLADAAAEERHRLVDQLKIEQLVEIIDEVRGTSVANQKPAPPPPNDTKPRGQYAQTSTLSVGTIAVALGVGIAIGFMLRKPTHA